LSPPRLQRLSCFADLRRAPRGAVEPGEVADHRAALVHAASTTNRVRHLAIIELFLEATRHPELLADMSALRTSQLQLMRDIHHAAGLELEAADAALLITAITGIVHFALTTPEAIDLRSPDEIRALVRRAVDLIHARAARHVA
jgi:hypothetical protein